MHCCHFVLAFAAFKLNNPASWVDFTYGGNVADFVFVVDDDCGQFDLTFKLVVFWVLILDGRFLALFIDLF